MKIALQFYKEYNSNYYNIIIENIKSKKIIINQFEGKTFTDAKKETAYIRLYGNDGDLYIIVHELAHFIDKTSKPAIIPNKYWFLSETFALYIEKKLEVWLKDKKYKSLISTRINNRVYFESKMLEAVKNELYYENLFKQRGTLEKSDVDSKKFESIIKYDVPYNIVNYLLQYPLANILSDYLINNNIMQHDNELAEECMNLDLYKVLKKYQKNLTIYNIKK